MTSGDDICALRGKIRSNANLSVGCAESNYIYAAGVVSEVLGAKNELIIVIRQDCSTPGAWKPWEPVPLSEFGSEPVQRLVTQLALAPLKVPRRTVPVSDIQHEYYSRLHVH